MDYKRILLVTAVPPENLDAVLEALAGAGAGVVGHYTHCSFSHAGTGRFKPDAAANPAVGQNEQINQVDEVRIETFFPRERAKAVVTALRAAHPYEEPVIYLLPLIEEADV